MKNLSCFAFLLLSLVLFTCEKDSIIENKTVSDLQAKPSLRIYNLNTDSVFTTNSILKNKITNTFFNKGEANSVNKITSSYGFSIHEEYTRLVATDSYESYSFVVERDVPLLNVLENYVLTIFNNGDYIQMLVSYPEVLINGEVQYDLTNITAEYINDDALVFKNLCENFADNVVEWDDSAGECFPFPCGGATGNGQHMPENEDECRANGSDRPFTSCQGAWVVSDCGSGSGVGVDNTNNNLTSSGSTTTTNNDVDFIGITPLKLTAQQQLKNNLGINNLTPEIVNWIDDPANSLLIGSVNQFLTDNDFSEEAQASALVAIIDSADDTEEDYPGKDIGLPFNWWLDSDFIINSGNFDIDDEEPNAKEAALFAIFRNQAVLHIENSIVALDKAEELVTNGVLTGLNNGKADAFRHAFWNALGTAEFGSYVMKLFADAHEWGEIPGDSVNMDFHNNHEGRNIGEGFDFFSSDNSIASTIMTALVNGVLKYINGSGVLVYTNQ